MADTAPDGWRADRLRVEPEQVLAVMKVLTAESARLLAAARRARAQGRWVGPCGGDPVSRDAAAAFNQRIDLMVDGCQRYAQELDRAGRSLARIAKDYGHTDAEIQSALRDAVSQTRRP